MVFVAYATPIVAVPAKLLDSARGWLAAAEHHLAWTNVFCRHGDTDRRRRHRARSRLDPLAAALPVALAFSLAGATATCLAAVPGQYPAPGPFVARFRVATVPRHPGTWRLRDIALRAVGGRLGEPSGYVRTIVGYGCESCVGWKEGIVNAEVADGTTEVKLPDPGRPVMTLRSTLWVFVEEQGMAVLPVRGQPGVTRLVLTGNMRSKSYRMHATGKRFSLSIASEDCYGDFLPENVGPGSEPVYQSGTRRAVPCPSVWEPPDDALRPNSG